MGESRRRFKRAFKLEAVRRVVEGGHRSSRQTSGSLRSRLLVVGLALAGCHRESPPVVTLQALDMGDRACYVVVAADGGKQSLEGDFDLCPGGAREASALIGQRVILRQHKERVQAASCQGNPECDQFDEVDLVVAITPAPG